MKHTLSLLLALCALCGCTTQKNLTNLVKALAKDPATVNINLSSVYGTLRFERYVPGQTNILLAPDIATLLQAYQFSRFTQPAAPAPVQIFYVTTNAPIAPIPPK